MSEDFSTRVAALEFAVARNREQLAEQRLLFRFILAELASHLASHANGGQSPSQWAELFIADVRKLLDEAERANQQSPSPVSQRLYEQVRNQLALFATDLFYDTDLQGE